jgi:protein TonB
MLWVWQPALVQIAPASTLAVFDIAPPEEPVSDPVPPEEPRPDQPEPTPSDVEPSELAPLSTQPAPQPLAPAVALPSVAAPSSPPPAAAKQPAPRPNPSAEQSADWHARVLGRLNAMKAYPASARARRQQGVVLIRFILDRQGQVLSVSLVQGSGFAPLDREALALPKRATPLPMPPDDVPGQQIELVVPVEFHL